jgi:hypothetical protein
VNLRPEVFLNLVYLDDSCDDSGYQLVGAAIVQEDNFLLLEDALALLAERLVPEKIRDDFEFHASAMLNGKDSFADLGRDKALAIFSNCVDFVEHTKTTVVYGAVNMPKLRAGRYATAQPIDIAFRGCLDGLVEWFKRETAMFSVLGHSIGTLSNLGILICDDTKNQHIKDNLRKAYRAYRRRLRSTSQERGRLAFVHDDMYFGDSAYSSGIQLADICSYIILRHLQQKPDTEYLFQRLKPHIFWGLLEPEGINENAITPDAKVKEKLPGEVERFPDTISESELE